MFDLCCGLGGATEGFLAEGWDCIGVDIERHQYGDNSYPAQLWIQDLLTISGAQLRDANFLWASVPCQFFSYTAMPWSKAKALAAKVRADPVLLEKELALFNACFRIQREACEAAGRHIPMVLENVKGAQPWVGRARWSFGSFYLWGDVPALMPITVRAVKVRGMGAGWKHPDDPRHVPGLGFNTHADRRLREAEGIKQRGSGREWFAGDGKISRMTSSKSPARKMASAMIAKIPEPLSRHIARSFYPRKLEAAE